MTQFENPPTDPEELKQYKKRLNKEKNRLLQLEIEKNSKPFKLATFFVQRPFATLTINFFIFIICIAVTFPLGLFNLTENTDREYLIWDDRRVEEFDMQVSMEEAFQESQSGSQELDERSQENIDWYTTAILKCLDCDNVLTAEGFKYIVEIEDKIKALKNYNKFCLATTGDSSCSSNAIFSVSTLISNLGYDAYNLSDTEVNDIIDQIIANQQMYEFLLDKSFNSSNRKAQYIRNIFNFGTPLKIDGKTYKNKFDRQDEQDDHFDEFSQDILDFQTEYLLNFPDKYGFYVFSQPISNIIFQNVVNSDSMWAIASVLFVFIYISLHVGSFFIGIFSIILILVSFPISMVIYGIFFQIKYFSNLHIMAVFVILGISADDLFVLVDAWKQTGYYNQIKHDDERRMALTFRRAAWAMLATSSTTSAAFLATGLSDIMPISAFGIFAGILVPINYLLTIFFMPCILIIRKKMPDCPCRKRKNKDQAIKSPQLQQQIQQDTENNVKSNQGLQYIENQKQISLKGNSNEMQNPKSQTGNQLIQNQQNNNKNDNDDDEEEEEQNLPPVEKFFVQKFNPFVYKARYIIIAIVIIWVGIAIWQATKLSPLTKPEVFLPEDNQTEISQKLILEGFHASAQSNSGIKVYQYWGVEGLNKDGVSMWDAEDLGELIWDNDFEFISNQEWFYDYCTDLQSNELVQDNTVESFIFTFKTYATSNCGGFPVASGDFMPCLNDYVESDTDGIQFFSQNRIGIIDGTLKYVEIEVPSTGVPFQPHKVTFPLWEKWNDLVQKTNNDAPTGMKDSKFTALYHFTWMISEKSFADNAIQGMLISMLFAFLVLVLSTHNIIVAFYSIISIACIVVSCLAIIVFNGWQLGVAESVAVVVLIGMSVDYVVHLANHYVESIYPDRYHKMMSSLRDLGISIVSSGATTIGSGVFLVFAKLLLFNKFAILVISTILFSLFFALFFFSAVCHTIGPERNQGNLLYLLKKCRGKNKVQGSPENSKQISNSVQKGQNKQSQSDLEVENIDSNRPVQISSPAENKQPRNDYN